MTIYYSVQGEVNRPAISRAATDSIVTGRRKVCQSIVDLINQHPAQETCLLALDGYLGIEWNHIIPEIKTLLEDLNVEAIIIDMSCYLKTHSEITEMIAPSLNHILDFGYVFGDGLEQFFDPAKLEQLKKELTACQSESKEQVVLCYGSGAFIPSLKELYNHIYYFDLTREELFNRSEERPVHFLGDEGHSKPVHKSLRRFYYVESQVLDKHKRDILAYMDCYVDSIDTNELKLVPRAAYDEILSSIALSPIRVKLLYYPTSWGGNWQKNLRNLPQSMENSGQGFLVANENSLEIALDRVSLEIPFQNLLWKESLKILGQHAFNVSQGNFPLNYWYDDEIGGGHMAIQVHPDGDYVREHFNEPMRQDESYYILHTESNAKTYLGLTEDADLDEFRRLTTRSEDQGIPFDYEKYVNSIPTKPGDFLLIPAGIIHASGRNQAVVEIDWVIAAYTPGYTFHFYDYLSPDLEGGLRPIHIDRSFDALDDKRSEWVLENLKQDPELLRSGDGWAEYVLGRRDEMLFEVRRLEFEKYIQDETEQQGTFHALTLVEGESVLLQSQENPDQQYKLGYPDTIIIPAYMGRYSITNLGNSPCKIVKALVR